jgi:hypothetical protein
VISQRRSRNSTIGLGQRVEHGLMPRGRSRTGNRAVAERQCDKDAEKGVQVTPKLKNATLSESTNNRSMEGMVEIEKSIHFLREVQCSHLPDDPSKFSMQRCWDRQRQLASAVFAKKRVEFTKFIGIGGLEFRDPCPTMRVEFDEPFAFKAAKRFSDRASADMKRIDERLLGEPCPRRQVSQHDLRPQLSNNLIGECAIQRWCQNHDRLLLRIPVHQIV